MLNHILLAVLWIVYCVIHSVLAAERVKNYFSKMLGENFKYYRLIYNLIAFITLVPIIIFHFRIQQVFVFTPTIVITVCGFALSISGALIMTLMIWKYFLQMIGIRLIEKQETGKLQVDGLHRYVRHPLYLGTFMFIWGLFLIFPYSRGLIACTIITTYTLIAIKFEEEKLLVEFGEEYKMYRQRVPMIVTWSMVNDE